MTNKTKDGLFRHILVINSGSSSLKFTLFDAISETMLAKGLVERIGTPSANLQYQKDNQGKIKQAVTADDHAEALLLACTQIIDPEHGVLKSLEEVDAIGHRVVHGGERFKAPTKVDDSVKKGITACAALAPLHNPANLGGIIACERVFPETPNVAIFDTAYHASMPPHAFLYAIPYKYYQKHAIRKYGFHGTSHSFVAQAAADRLGKPLSDVKLITCHMGNGCSIAAVNGGNVVDTTMGMTPLAGLVMGTRCGDIDPAIVLFLVRQGMTPDAIDDMLNKKSGLLGVGGINSGDMRDIVDATENGEEHAARAMRMFVHRAVLYIGGYFTILGGADAIIFTGGIGENSAYSRGHIVSALGGIGCKLDEERNRIIGKETLLTTDDSTLPVIVIPTNEELKICRETVTLLAEETDCEE